MKKIMAIILALTLTFSLVACGGDSSSAAVSGSGGATGSGNMAVAEDGKVYVGVCSHLSGSYSYLYEYAKESFDVCLDHLNANGGIMGHEVEVVWFDLGDSIDTAMNAFELATEDKRLSTIVMSTFSQNCLAVLDAATSAKIPTFMGGSGDAINTGADYIWMNRPLDSSASATIVTYAVDTLKYTKPVICYNTLASTQAGAEYMIEYLGDRGIKVDDSHIFGYSNEEKNFDTYAAQVKSLIDTGECDGILCFGNQTDLAALAKSLDAAGCDVPCMGNAQVINETTLSLAGASINGWYSVAESYAEDEGELNQEFREIYNEATGHYPTTNLYGGYFLFYLEALCEKAGDPYDRDYINEAIKEVEFDTPSGVYKYWGEGDSNLRNNMYVCVVEDGAAKILNSVEYR